MTSDLLPSSAVRPSPSSVAEEDVINARGVVAGLVVEEFQKTKHVLVAECPFRVWLLGRSLFGVDGDMPHFEPLPHMTPDLVLNLVSTIPNVPDHLQPSHFSSSRKWAVPVASAPNKSRSKPNGRRPLINRSHWPAAPVERAVAHCLDYASNEFMPHWLHLDLHRTDAVPPLIQQFNEYEGFGVVHRMGSDLSSCFTYIKHALVDTAWRMFRSCLESHLPGMSAPRHRRGHTCPFFRPLDIRHMVNFTFDEIEEVIFNHLHTAFFLVGKLVVRQTGGLPMGSHLAPALTRMVLIYLDIFHYVSKLQSSLSLALPSARLHKVTIDCHEIVLLEMRYVDDYLALWKFASSHSPSHDPFLVQDICAKLYASAQERYPLPMERDEGDTFVGLLVDLRPDGFVHTSPATIDSQLYGDIFDYPPVIDFRSHVPLTVKRAVVVGIVHRVDQYTVPSQGKPDALQRFCRLLVEQHFPLHLIRKWALSTRGGALSWVAALFS